VRVEVWAGGATEIGPYARIAVGLMAREMGLCWRGLLYEVSLMRISHLTIRGSIMTVLVTMGFLGVLFGQPNGVAPEPKFTELSSEDRARLEQQRAVVATAANHQLGAMLTKTKSDLPILQRIIDDRVFKKSQTYELQCLGVAFGDVLASELPLRWVMVTDEYGTDPTLRFKETTVQINALTMISKRVERDEAVNIFELLRLTREQLADHEKRNH
jgi:hypothetical protein